jgi:hypothetical protein
MNTVHLKKWTFLLRREHCIGVSGLNKLIPEYQLKCLHQSSGGKNSLLFFIVPRGLCLYCGACKFANQFTLAFHHDHFSMHSNSSYDIQESIPHGILKYLPTS